MRRLLKIAGHLKSRAREDGLAKIFIIVWFGIRHLIRGFVREKINRKYYEFKQNRNGINVMEQDWDSLIILDAARPDYFKNVCDIDGRFEARISKGSNSSEWMKRNFHGEEYHDTVYVSANPYADDLPEGTFHDIVPLYDTAWDSELGTVPPDDVTDAAIQAHQQHPNKRIIVHYMQPHIPFLRNSNMKMIHLGESYGPHPDSGVNRIRQAYRENLKVVIESVQSLLDHSDGKVVISSDHGEMLGEYQRPIPVRGFDHRPTLYLKELTSIPWLIIDKGERRTITRDPPQNTKTISDEKITSRLESLGYV